MTEELCVECGFIRLSLIQCAICGKKICLSHVARHRQKDKEQLLHLKMALKQEGLA